jgi:CheY-like chemotaxis protein
MRILYLEDEPADAQLVERYIRLTQNQVTIANNVADARAALEEPPDMVLVDILLNRTREGYTQPIIAVTGLTLRQEIEQCYRSGVTDILTKPYTANQLAQILDKYLPAAGTQA